MSCMKGSVEGAPGDTWHPEGGRRRGTNGGDLQGCLEKEEEEPRKVAGRDTQLGEGAGGPGGWGLRGSSGLGTSEVTDNFGESNVSWGHAEYRSQNAEGEDRKEGREIMNFDGEKDYREYLKDEGRRKILVSF